MSSVGSMKYNHARVDRKCRITWLESCPVLVTAVHPLHSNSSPTAAQGPMGSVTSQQSVDSRQTLGRGQAGVFKPI